MAPKPIITVVILIASLFAGSAGRENGTAAVLARTDSAESSILFIENVGQFADGARFQVRGGPATIWLAEDAIWYTVLAPQNQTGESAGMGEGLDMRYPPSMPAPQRGVNLRLSFPGANPRPRLEPFDRLGTRFSYFLGNDRTKWHPDVPVWGGVRYVDLYPGVDLELTTAAGRYAQMLVVKPDADVSRLQLQVEGASFAIGTETLYLATPSGDILIPLTVEGEALSKVKLARDALARNSKASSKPSDSAPVGLTHSVGDWATKANRVSQAPQDNPSDLLYSSYLGGTNTGDCGYGVAVDQAGAVYVTGQAGSVDFPTTPGAFDVELSNFEVFVAKLVPVGNGQSDLIFSTFVGGTNQDWGYAIAVDGSGNTYVTGETRSSDFPNTHDAVPGGCFFGGGPDAFLTVLNAAGSGLLNSTFVGGASFDFAYDLALHGGDVYLAGMTVSSNFPVTEGAFDTSYNGAPGSADAFMIKLDWDDAGCDPTYSTYLGGSLGEGAYGIAVGADNSIYVAGATSSDDFPATDNAYDTVWNGEDVFVVKLRANGQGPNDLAYASFLGGSGSDCYYTGGCDVAVDEDGKVYVAAISSSPDFPVTPGAYNTAYPPVGGASFVAKLDMAGRGNSDLLYATYLNFLQQPTLAVDSSGNVYVGAHISGSTSPLAPITPGAFDTTGNGPTNLWIGKLQPQGNGSADLAYGTYLGGGYERCWPHCGLAVDAEGAVYIAGSAESTGYPVTANAFDISHNGWHDAVVSKLGIVGFPEPVLASRSGDKDVRLAWQDNPANCGYEIHRSETPYFQPQLGTLRDTLPQGSDYYVDTGALDAGQPSYFYLVVAINCGETMTSQSNQTGTFAFGLVPGQ